MVKRTSDQNSK